MSTFSVVQVVYERPEAQLIEADTHMTALLKSEGVSEDDEEAKAFYSEEYQEGGNGFQKVDDYVCMFWHQEGFTIITRVDSHTLP